MHIIILKPVSQFLRLNTVRKIETFQTVWFSLLFIIALPIRRLL